MRRLANKVRQVLVVYATRGQTWGWLSLSFVFLLPWLLLFPNSGGKSSGNVETGWMFVIASYFYCSWFASLLADQTKFQFAHPRAKLLPGFALPHVFVPAAIAVFVGLVLPAGIAFVWIAPPLVLIAISSLMFAVLLLSRFFPIFAWIACGTFILGIYLPTHFGYDIWELGYGLSPSICLVATAIAWTAVAYYLIRLRTLHEEEGVYQQSLDETQKVRADGIDGQTRAQFKQFARWWFLSDRWHARIGDYHQQRRARIIRSLRYGFGAPPVEFVAAGYAFLIMIAVIFITPKCDDSYDISRSTDYVFLILPALFASLAPLAVAGGAFEKRLPRMANELMFPLTRRQLIENLLLAAASYSITLWIIGCAVGAVVLFVILPSEAIGLSLFATAAALCAVSAVAAFGLSLNIVLWEVRAAQFFVMGLFVLGIITLLLTWWTSREDTGDAPFWVAAAIVGAVGVVMIRSAHDTWLNLELG